MTPRTRAIRKKELQKPDRCWQSKPIIIYPASVLTMPIAKEDALVSIIIPVYNTKNYLKRCLDSISQQSHQHFEVIIVNDGSTDFSSNKISEEIIRVTQGDSRFRFFYQSNQGAGAARNLGLEHANGEYVAFIDSDDSVEPDYLQAMYQQMQHDNSLLCFCAIKRIYPNSTDENAMRIFSSYWEGAVVSQ